MFCLNKSNETEPGTILQLPAQCLVAAFHLLVVVLDDRDCGLVVLLQVAVLPAELHQQISLLDYALELLHALSAALLQGQSRLPALLVQSLHVRLHRLQFRAH